MSKPMSLRREAAELVNACNRLPYDLAARNVGKDWIMQLDQGHVIATVQLLRVQWYQCEIRHLAVREDRRRHGFGDAMVASAEDMALRQGACMMQCTIRADNKASVGLFKKRGYKPGVTFFSPATGNTVRTYQKSLRPVPTAPSAS